MQLSVASVPPIPGASSVNYQFPPTPPSTAKQSRKSSVGDVSEAGFSSTSVDSDCSVSSTELEAANLVSKPYPLPPRSRPKTVLPEDFKTPDSHVQRDPRLIRLTGLHPFNSEAPLTDLYDEGFLTSQDLHYVRNHGPVPKCEDDDMLDWTFTVDGMVENPLTMTVRDLLKDYEQTTYPVTLVCAGNRRKEQNMVRKSKGFSWGPAGVSTALWTGVALRDLLARAVPERRARFVYFEGADKLPNGCYGTSVKLNWCMDPNRGIMVAHKVNGEKLHLDHGKPVRIIIPGQIGARSVKWLTKITVGAEPSDNWYHIYDNRVLPTMISPEASADLPETWKDERYAIYDLNVNSAICSPAHDERVALTQEKYTVKGYAYAGGGKRVSRIEVTLDKGKSWRLANIRYPEDDYRLAPHGDTLYGGVVDMWWRETCFCWCFWEIDVAMGELTKADDIMVRAMDEGMMVQPRDMYWSVLGMMNNPWFRVAVHNDGSFLRFEHPTQPALIPGGWMERVKKAGGNLANGFWGEKAPGDDGGTAPPEKEKETCMTSPDVKREVSLEELKQHDSETQPWFVVKGEVYDGTAFLEEHPGGAASIFGTAAQDATEEFMSIHSENAKAMMPAYHVGSLDKASVTALAGGAAHEVEADPQRAVFLQSRSWTRAVLEHRAVVSPDSKIFHFRLDHAEQQIGLPVGQHLLMRLRDPASREAIIRAYTPISETADRGVLRVLVKIYRDTPASPGGRMTQALDAIPVGHAVDFKGPVGRFEYLGKGRCRVSGQTRTVRRFVMICAGSGVTPIFQVLRAVVQDSDDPTTCLVLDGNRTEEDILCREELDGLAAARGNRCRLVYSLTQPLPTWQGRKGRMDRALFEKEAGTRPAQGGDSDEMVLVCGPEAMETVVRETFLDMGWKDDDLLFF